MEAVAILVGGAVMFHFGRGLVTGVSRTVVRRGPLWLAFVLIASLFFVLAIPILNAIVTSAIF